MHLEADLGADVQGPDAWLLRAITFSAGAPVYACDSRSSPVSSARPRRYPTDYSVQVYVDASLVLQGRFEPLKQPYK